MNKLRQVLRQSPLKSIPIILGVLVLTLALNTYFYKVETDSLSQFKTILQTQSAEHEWDTASSILKMGSVAGVHQAKYIAKKVENDIRLQYPDLSELKTEFETGKLSEKFYEILEKNIYGDGESPAIYPTSYFVLVATEEGVMGIFSNNVYSNDSVSDDSIISWDDYIRATPNEPLAKKAIDAVLSKDTNLVFWQKIPLPNGEKSTITDMNLELLKDTYVKYGPEGLRYYSLLASSYITDSGDIFDTADYTYGTKNKNYKIIILQSINMYDILEKYADDITQVKHDNNTNSQYLDDFVMTKTAKIIFSNFIVILICIIFSNVYNVERPKKKESEGDDMG